MFAFGMGGGQGARGGFPTRFEEQYHCYPVSFQDKEHMEDGDKILLPSSALDTLARLHVEYPMLFEISNPSEGKVTHCGVLEFSATEGSCYIPFWMMQNLLLEAGGLITIKNVSLPKATFVCFQAQSVDFLDISNPKAVLERQLRHFSCVTKGDQICIPYNGRKYYIEIKQVKPADAACIIETDCNVDFEPPVGYEEHLRKQKEAAAANGAGAARGSGSAAGASLGGMSVPAPVSGKAAPAAAEEPAFVPFTGGGARLDGKAAPTLSPADAAAARLAAAERRASSRSGSTSSTSSTDAAAAAAAAKAAVVPGVAPPAARKSSAAKQFAKRKLQTGAFQGQGNSMS